MKTCRFSKFRVTRRPSVPYTLGMTSDTRETRASASEIKFLLDERQAPAIRAWARANL